MKINKLTYFGHIIRHESLQKTILTGKVEGGRGRGRPRRQWYDDVKEWTGNKMSVNIRLAEDRVAWRKVARQPRDCAVRTNCEEVYDIHGIVAGRRIEKNGFNPKDAVG